MHKAIALSLMFIFMLSGCKSIFNMADSDKISFAVPISEDIPLIDGNPDDDCWQKSKSVSLFITTTGYLASPQTTVSAMTDKKDLYLLFKCDYTNPDNLKAAGHSNNSESIFNDESIELFIDSQNSNSSYYHIAINTEGFCYAAFCEPSEKIRYKVSMEGAEIKTSADRKSWYAEIKIPLNALSAQIKKNTVWGINFCRNSKSDGSSSWAGIANFNKPEEFKKVSFGNKNPVYFIIDKADAVSATLRLFNNSEVTRTLKVAYVSDLFTFNEHITVAADSTNVLTIKNNNPAAKLEINPLAAKNISLTLKDAETDKLLASSFFKYNLSESFDSSLNLFYVYPGDILNISFTGNPTAVETVEIEVARNIGEASLKKIRFGKTALTATTPVNIEGLAPGRYILSTFYTDTKNDISYITRKAFFILQAKEETSKTYNAPFKIRSDGVITAADGTPFLLFTSSIAGQEKNISPLAKGAFPVNYNSPGNTASNIYIGQLGAVSLKRKDGKAYYLFANNESLMKKVEEYCTRKTPAKLLFTRLCYEAQIQWYLGTEMEAAKVDNIKYLNLVNAKVKELTPDGLTSIQIDNLTELENYKNVADIIEIAAYSSSYNRNIETGIEKDLNFINDLLNKKTYIYWIGASIPKPEARNAENIRFASYMALLKGSRGIIYHMGHGGIPFTMTRPWSVYKELGSELDALYPVITSTEKVPSSFISSKDSDIFIASRKSGNDFYLFAINKSTTLKHATFELSKSYGPSEIEAIFENRKITVNDKNIFSDFFLPLEVHVYKITVIEKK